jgi:hypothetical protein
LLAFLDTSALFGQNLRNILLWCSVLGAFEPRWTTEVLRELDENLASELGLAADAREHLLRELRGAFPDALVPVPAPPNGYGIADPDDVHVIDAAVAAGVDVLVTDDFKHFTSGVMANAGLRRERTPDFVIWCLGELPDRQVLRLSETFGAPSKIRHFPAVEQAFSGRLTALT